MFDKIDTQQSIERKFIRKDSSTSIDYVKEYPTRQVGKALHNSRVNNYMSSSNVFSIQERRSNIEVSDRNLYKSNGLDTSYSASKSPRNKKFNKKGPIKASRTFQSNYESQKHAYEKQMEKNHMRFIDFYIEIRDISLAG